MLEVENAEKCSSSIKDVKKINSDLDKDLNVSKFKLLKLNENEKLDFKDPGTWPKKIINSHRNYIVKMRVNYSEKLDFTRSERDGSICQCFLVFKNFVNGNQCRLNLNYLLKIKKCIILYTMQIVF